MTLCRNPPPLECQVLFEWPLTTKNGWVRIFDIIIVNSQRFSFRTKKNLFTHLSDKAIRRLGQEWRHALNEFHDNWLIDITKVLGGWYSMFHRFWQDKFDYGCSILSSRQFSLLPHCLLKMILAIKMIKVDSEIINSLS